MGSLPGACPYRREGLATALVLCFMDLAVKPAQSIVFYLMRDIQRNKDSASHL